jgi:hypothetical protein
MVSKRKDRDHKRDAIQRVQNRRRARNLLCTFGVWDAIRQSTVAERCLTTRYPAPHLRLAEDLPDTDETREVFHRANTALRNCTFDAPLLGTITVMDYFVEVKALLDLVFNVVCEDEPLKSSLAAARRCTATLADAETAARAVVAAVKDIDDVLIDVGRIDQRLYSVSIEHGRDEADQWFESFTLHCHEGRERWFAVDGKPRRAHQCGQPFGLGGVEWVEWDASTVGGPKGFRLPVFVQAHALDMLYRKEARALFVENGEWLVHESLWQSLRDPRNVQPMRGDGTHIVDYRFHGHRLGYLPVSVVGDALLVHTFLFLTMDGTPEGNMLKERLRLRRSDKQHLELDRIGTFLNTDVQHDPELREVLDACGCGTLFEMLKSPPPRERCIPGYAEEVRKYIGM